MDREQDFLFDTHNRKCLNSNKTTKRLFEISLDNIFSHYLNLMLRRREADVLERWLL